MSPREVIPFLDLMKTKNKILNEATRLFATNGFDAVSIRDIAKSVGIKSSSIYNHYTNKDALLEDILSKFEESYFSYFDWLKNENNKADSLEKIIENMFIELVNVQNMFIYYGIALILKEQFKNESARKKVFKLFYIDSVMLMQQDFDRLVENNIIPPCNTKMIATVLMNCVLIGNEMRIHESMQHDIPINVNNMYNDLKILITNMLKNGI